jgi:tryptophan halogenase
MEVPESLKRRMALYRQRGRIFREGSELFTEVGWLQVLNGQGLMPEAYNPLVDLYPEKDIEAFLNDIRSVIDRCVDVMPDHLAFIKDHCAAEPVAPR